MENWEKYDHLIWHPYSSLVPSFENLSVERAEGVNVYLTDGTVLLDGISSWWVNIHGHSHPKLAEALFKQAASLEHVIFAGFTHKPAVELAQKIITFTNCNFKKIFYSDNGSTAVEIALKMALQYWRNNGESRTKVIALQGAFHGDTFGAMSVSGRGVFSEAFESLMWEVDFLPFPSAECETECINKFAELLKGKPAAIIVEPLLQGAAGMRVYSETVLNTLFKMAKEAGVICIADEVLTGFGRTGKNFASDYITEKPDIMCLSKGLTGGTMAFGVTLANERIVEAFNNPDLTKVLYHGHSYTANPIACSVALASLELLLSHERQEQIERLTKWQKSFAERVRSDFPQLKRVDHIGTMVAIELNADAGYLSSIRDELSRFFIQNKVILRPLGNVVYFLPPYVIEREQVDYVHQVLINMLETKANSINNSH
jgi:adenosylmethionine---8-amino-7-oxononanoate aminotransferase